ncbi:hypothetical protein NC651_004874 [Populus alba x Populus x berolinensis]|nr:hypothetical protein NC651_004874 [Populus alba x Populus x berolinensis]
MPVKKMYSVCAVPAGDVEQGGNGIVKVTVVVQGSKYIERACTLARSIANCMGNLCLTLEVMIAGILYSSY